MILCDVKNRRDKYKKQQQTNDKLIEENHYGKDEVNCHWKNLLFNQHQIAHEKLKQNHNMNYSLGIDELFLIIVIDNVANNCSIWYQKYI